MNPILPSKELQLTYIRKANSLIQLKRCIEGDNAASLSLLQSKLLAFAISLMDQNAKAFSPVKFSMKDFWNKCGKTVDSKQYFTLLADAIKPLRDKSTWVLKTDPNTGKSRLATVSIFLKAEIDPYDKVVEVIFDPDMEPALLNLKSNYTRYPIESVMQLNSKYGFNLYELLCSYEYLHKSVTFSFEELAQLLDAPHYSRASSFKKRVIEAAIQDINTFTLDKMVTATYHKTGQSYTHVSFSFESKTVPALDVAPSDADAISESQNVIKLQISFDEICAQIDQKKIDCRKETLNLILDTITETLDSSQKTYSINQTQIPREKVIAVFSELTQEHILFVLERLRDIASDIRNPKAYIRAALYNAPATIGMIQDAKAPQELPRRKPDTEEIAAAKRLLAGDDFLAGLDFETGGN